MENSWSIAINFSYMDGKKNKNKPLSIGNFLLVTWLIFVKWDFPSGNLT